MGMNLTIDFDFDAFEEEVYGTARVVLPKLQRDRRGESFYTFNFLMGEVTDNVSMVAITEEELERLARRELQRDDRYYDLPYDDFKTYLRHRWYDYAIRVYPYDESEFARQFAKANDMLYEQSKHIIEMAMELVDDGDVDEDDYDDYVNENYHEPVEDRLKSVLQGLDKDGVSEMTNQRVSVHVGIQHPVHLDDLLPGPFYELNPPQSFQRYENDEEVYKR